MFGIHKKDLLWNLEKIRQQRCAYNAPEDSSCDCKFGKPEQEPSRGSETFSGCPEIRQAIEIIKTMDDDSFRMHCIMAGITIAYLSPKSQITEGTDPL